MTSEILNITFECLDAKRVAEFWQAAIDKDLTHVDAPENPYWVLMSDAPGGHRLVFVTVSEPKSGKSRVHLDLLPRHRDQRREVARLVLLGATVVDDRTELEPGGWAVMSDPEENEFCVE